MEHLYAPWRSKVLKPQKKDCIFCVKQKGKKDQKNLILFRGKTNFVMMNLYPYNDGHLMVSPYRHESDPNKLSREEWIELNEVSRVAVKIMKKAFNPDGFNVGMNLGKPAGAGIAEHLHQHIVPRWSGDTNFLPIIGKTKVVNQDFKKLYEKLFPMFNEI